MLWNGIPRVCFDFFPRNGITSIFPLRNVSERNPESFLFRGMVQSGIPRVCFYFCFMVQDSEHSSPLWRNGIPRILCSAEQPEFRRSKPIYFVFRGILFFCQKLPTLVSANEYVQLCTSYVTWGGFIKDEYYSWVQYKIGPGGGQSMYKESTLKDLVHLTPLRIHSMNPPMETK